MNPLFVNPPFVILAKSLTPSFVIPAKAGSLTAEWLVIQCLVLRDRKSLDPRFHGDDDLLV